MAGLLAKSMEGPMSDETAYSFFEGELIERDPELEDRYFEELVQKAKKGE